MSDFMDATRIDALLTKLTAAEARIEKLERAYGVLRDALTEAGTDLNWHCDVRVDLSSALERAEEILKGVE